jgi:hypothetical protein
MRDTIDMAREAGFETMITKGKIYGDSDDGGDYTEELKAFESLVRADEREACAKVCETQNEAGPACEHWWEYAAAIRARGNT